MSCNFCGGPLRTDKTIVEDPHYTTLGHFPKGMCEECIGYLVATGEIPIPWGKDYESLQPRKIAPKRSSTCKTRPYYDAGVCQHAD